MTTYSQELWNEIQRDAMPTLFFMKLKRIKKTKKIHSCMVCKKTIQIGSACEEHTIMDSDCKKPESQYYCGCGSE